MTTLQKLAPTHRTRLVEITAVRWTGANIDEMRELCGGRFTPLDPADCPEGQQWTAEVYCAASGLRAPVVAGEWVVRDRDDNLSVTTDVELDAEYEPIAPAGPHRVTVTQAWAPGSPPTYQVEHPESCHQQRYEALCPFDQMRLEVGTAAWPAEPGVYEAAIRSAHCGSPEFGEWDRWIEWTLISAAAGQ